MRDSLYDRRLEALISELLAQLVDGPAADIDRKIDQVLGRIGEVFGIDLVVLWEWSGAAPESILATHHFVSDPGFEPPMSLDESQYPWVREQMLAGRTVSLASLDQVPPEAAIDRKHGELLGIKSNLCIPLVVGDEPPLGALALNTLRVGTDWPAQIVGQVHLASKVLAMVLARRRLVGTVGSYQARLLAGAQLAGLGFYEANHEVDSLQGDDVFTGLLGIDPCPPRYSDVEHWWAERVDPEDLPRLMELLGRLHCGEVDVITDEYRYQHPHRGQIWISHLAASGQHGADGRILMSVGVIRDVGHQKRIEADLRAMSQSLLNAQEQERKLIAQELHDDLSQRLAALSIAAGRAEAASADQTQAATLKSIREQLVRISEDVHTLAYQLHPAVLEELGLAEALRTECERRARRGGPEISCSIDLAGSPVSKETALCLFRVAQEALSNAIHHARAGRVALRLTALDDGIALAVGDDGVGFELCALKGHISLGLASMKERMRVVRGTLDVDSTPGSGTTVIAWAPVGGGSS
jgi:signal transduction histidine kinase